MAQIVGLFAAIVLGVAVLATAFGGVLPTWTLAISVPAWMGAIVLARRSDHDEPVVAIDPAGLVPTDRLSPAPLVLADWDLVPMDAGSDALADPGDPPIVLLRGRGRDDHGGNGHHGAVRHEALIAVTAGVNAGWRFRGTSHDLGSDDAGLPAVARTLAPHLRSAGSDAELLVDQGWLAVATPWPPNDGALPTLVDETRRIVTSLRATSATS